MRDGPPRVGAALPRRARAQWPLLAAVFATLVVCGSLVGVSALLLTEGQHRALAAAVAEADGTVDSGGPDLVTAFMEFDAPEEGEPQQTTALVETATATMQDAVLPYSSTASVWAASPMMFIPGADVRQGYLLDADSATAHGRLTTGRWPAPTRSGSPTEAAIPVSTAAQLGLDVGSSLRLTPSAPHTGAPPPDGVDLVVVGVFVPDGTSSWTRDVLQGAGFRLEGSWLPAYGPFLVAPGTLIEADGPLARLSIVVDPTLSGEPGALPGVARAVGELKTGLTHALGPRLETAAVQSDLGAMLARDRAEQNLTAAIVLVVVLLVLALGIATLGLVGRLVVQRRAPETAILVNRGASRPQLAGRAAVEALCLAIAAGALAAPIALGVYRGLIALPPLESAWSGASTLGAPTLGWALAGDVMLGAVVPSLALVAVAVRGGAQRRTRRGAPALARSGADLLVVALAVLAYLQLRAHSLGTGSIDPVLVVGPVVCVVAGALLALRALPVVARLAEVRARRGTGLVLPLAGWQVSRGRATSGAFLMILASASAAFGVLFLGTWHLSQGDQADAAVGTDLAIGEVGPVDTDVRLAELTGGTVVPVTDRKASLGSRPGGTQLIALDTTKASEVLRGRLPGGETWASATEGLAPDDAVASLSVVGGGTGAIRLTLDGVAGGGTLKQEFPLASPLMVSPTVFVEDEWGNRLALDGPAVELDGSPHDVLLPTAAREALPQGRWSVVAMDLRLSVALDWTAPIEFDALTSARVSVRVADAEAGPGEWYAARLGQASAITASSTHLTGTTVTATFDGHVYDFLSSSAHVTLLSFKPVDDFPALVSDDLARNLGLSAGEGLAITSGAATTTATVVGIVPYVPGAPRGNVVMADSNALGRALLSAGSVESFTDAWWVGTPGEGAETAVAALGLGSVQSRESLARDLRDGPLRVALRVALGLLVASALVLAVAGTAAHAASVAEARASEVARLRGIGASRRMLYRAGVLQHAAVTAGAAAGGGALGALLAWLLGPLLIVGPGGAPATPAPLVVWDPLPLALTLAALVVAGFLVGIPAVRAQVGRDAALGLRMGDAP